MSRHKVVVLARRYVDQSNRHCLDELFPMFEPDATYRSSQFGLFIGLEQIREMMKIFFANFSDVHWEVDDYHADSEDIVSFKFSMRANNADTGQLVQRWGVETITFSRNELIRHIEVKIS